MRYPCVPVFFGNETLIRIGFWDRVRFYQGTEPKFRQAEAASSSGGKQACQVLPAMEWPACLPPDDAPRRSCRRAMFCRRCSRQVMRYCQSGFHRLPLRSAAPATFTAMPCRPRGRERGTRVATVGRQGGQVADKVGGVGLRSDSEADREQPERRQKGRAVRGTVAGRNWPLPFAGARPLYLRWHRVRVASARIVVSSLFCVVPSPVLGTKWRASASQAEGGRLYHGSTSGSGSECPGSNPPAYSQLYKCRTALPGEDLPIPVYVQNPLHTGTGKAVSLRVKARACPVVVSPCAALPFTLRSGSSRSLREARKSLHCPFCPPPAGGGTLPVAPCSLRSPSRSRACRRMAVGGGIEAIFSQL